MYGARVAEAGQACTVCPWKTGYDGLQFQRQSMGARPLVIVDTGLGNKRPPATSAGSHAVPLQVWAPDESARSPIIPGGSPLVGTAWRSEPDPVEEMVCWFCEHVVPFDSTCTTPGSSAVP